MYKKTDIMVAEIKGLLTAMENDVFNARLNVGVDTCDYMEKFTKNQEILLREISSRVHEINDMRKKSEDGDEWN